MQLVGNFLKFIFFCLFVVKELSFNSNTLKQNQIIHEEDTVEIVESIKSEENIDIIEDISKDINVNKIEDDEEINIDLIQNFNVDLDNDATNNITINENNSINVIQDDLTEKKLNNEQLNDEQQNKVDDSFNNNQIINEDIYPTVEACNEAALEIAFKDTTDIINVYCFSVAENGKLLGYITDINCLSGNCNKYK